jgi:hypothetical protein
VFTPTHNRLTQEERFSLRMYQRSFENKGLGALSGATYASSASPWHREAPDRKGYAVDALRRKGWLAPGSN